MLPGGGVPLLAGQDPAGFLERQGPGGRARMVAVGGVCDNDVKIECVPGDMVPALPQLILPLGFDGIRRRAEEKLAELDFNTIENFSRRDFWRSVIICCEGFSILCERHAREAQAQMSGAGPKRRADH